MPFATLRRLAAWRPGSLALNTAHAGVWNLVRVVLQAGSLVVMARHFGASGYGILAGSVAVYITFAQLAGLGSGVALVRYISRHGDVYARLRATQGAYLITSAALFLLVWPISTWLLGGKVHPSTLALLAGAELVAAPAILPLAYRHQALEGLWISGALTTIAPFARLVAVLIALALQMHDLDNFAVLYFVCLSLAAFGALFWLWPRNGTRERSPTFAAVREGLPFTVSGLATTAGSELDKTIVLRSVGDAAAGQYSASYRLVMAATLPVNSLIMASASRMFGQTRSGLSSFHGLLVATALGYALLASTLVLILAPLLPYVLGPQFDGAVALARWLCLVLVTASVRQVVSAELTTSAHQHARNIIEMIALALLLATLLLLVPRAGAPGAIIASVIADCMVILAGYAYLHHERHRRVHE